VPRHGRRIRGTTVRELPVDQVACQVENPVAGPF
jgi:hypothetical protein